MNVKPFIAPAIVAVFAMYLGYTIAVHSNIPSPLGDGTLCVNNINGIDYMCFGPGEQHKAYSLRDGVKVEEFTW